MNIFYTLLLSLLVIFSASNSLSALGFQEQATPLAEGLVDLHNYVFFYLVLVLVFVVWMFSNIVYHFFWRSLFPSNLSDLTLRQDQLDSNLVTHGTELEVIWTIVPSLILVFIAVPSFSLLYAMDEVVNPALTLHAIGHQWYWSYEFTDGPQAYVYDSYMLADDRLQTGDLRLLQTDTEVVLPVHTHLRVLVSATDVLHCWTVPSLGVKVDAVPGRLNQLNIFTKRQGVFYGQCSELCGVKHGFMPIVVRVVSLDQFIDWLNASDR